MKLVGLLLLLFFTSLSLAQKTQITNPDVVIGVKSSTSLPFDQIRDDHSIWPLTRALKDGYTPKKDWILHQSIDPSAMPQGVDPAWQEEYVPAKTSGSRSVDENWDGVDYTGVNPADPSLDVGPNHVVQIVNNTTSSIVRIWSKTGTQLSSVLLSSITGIAGAGDPIVIYDQLSDRWLLTERGEVNNELIIAISTSPDPAGSYYVYQFPTPNLPDYPKYSIWPDAYYVTTNESSGKAYALERDKMLTGAASPKMASFTFANFPTIGGFQTPTPTSLSGTTLPPPGTPQYIMRIADDAWAVSVPEDRLEVYEFMVDWIDISMSTLTGPTNLITQPFDTDLCGYTSFACMDQPNTSVKLDPLKEVLMNRVYYRNFGPHQSIVCNHVTDVDGTDRGGVRWYELRRNSADWSIYQQGTYSPDADDRWLAGIGINANGCIGLAYNVSSSSTYPSIRHTGRIASDPLGTMTEPETTLASGSAANSSNRYGDYNCLVVDPSDDLSFWFTGKYNTTSNWRTRVSKFTFGPQAPSINFQTSNLTVSESTNNQISCLGFKDYTIGIQISMPPTMPVDITINSSGTAVEGNMQDVEVMPKTFTLDANNLSQSITLRIYDDRSIEPTESLLLGYTFDPNGGNAVAGSIGQTFTLTIDDNEVVPTGSVVQLYNQNFNSSPNDVEVFDGGNTNDTWHLRSDYNGSSLNGTPFAFVDSDATGSSTIMNEIMQFPITPLISGQTATLSFLEYYRDWNDGTELGYVDVYDGNFWQRILTHVSGGGDIGSWSNPNPVNLDVSAYANPNFQVRIGYEANYDYWWAVDNLVITQFSAADVATDVTAINDTFYFGSYASILAFDENNKIIARIKNLSSYDFGCATLAVDRAGNGATTLNGESNQTLAYTDKTCFLSFLDGPQNGNAYEITLYYDDAEKQGWESATGRSWIEHETVISRFNQHISNSSNTSISEIGITTEKSSEFNANLISAVFSDGPGGIAVSHRDNSANCVSYKFIAGNPVSGSYLVQDSIDSDAAINNNKTVVYSAGQNVELLTNFEVDLGSSFEVSLGGCSSSSLSLTASASHIPFRNQMIDQSPSNDFNRLYKTHLSAADTEVIRDKQNYTINNLATINDMKPKDSIIHMKNSIVARKSTKKMKPAYNRVCNLSFQTHPN